ncbi:MAG: type IV pilus assembly protein PilM [Gemmatimonadota bacterium]|nr:type IV pilus assembly protein PilM [Gemmatimonadota bacterium]
MAVFRRKRKTVGLDIGSAFAKLVEVDHGGDTPELTRVAVAPVPQGALTDGEVTGPGRLGALVQKLGEALPTGTAEVVTALGGHDVFMKILSMTSPSGAPKGEAVRREAEHHVPFDLREIQLDYHVLGADPDDGSADVLLVAAKRERVEARVALLGSAGLGVSLIDVEALALHNMLVHNHPEAADGMATLVNVGHEVTSVNILDDGMPVFAKGLPFGLGWILERLRRARGLTRSEAEQALRHRQYDTELASVVDTVAGHVVTGVERASAVITTRTPRRGIGRVYMSGGGACIPGLADYVARRVKVETRLANPCERVLIRPGLAAHWALDQAAPMLGLAIGLALRTA